MSFQLNLDTESVTHAFPVQPIYAEPSTPVSQVLEILKANNRGNITVCEDGALVGIFTERDALKMIADGADLEVPIADVMIRNPVTVLPTDTVGKAIALMSEGGYRRLPIVDAEGKPQGVVKVSGILHYLVEHFPNMIYTLPPDPHHATQRREGA